MELAEQHQERLSERGKEIFAEGKQRLLNQSSFRGSLPIPADEIAFKKLESMGLSHNKWLDVAYAAEERRMFSLAADAHDRSMPFIDPDTERDRREMEKENAWASHDLKTMRSEAEN